MAKRKRQEHDAPGQLDLAAGIPAPTAAAAAQGAAVPPPAGEPAFRPAQAAVPAAPVADPTRPRVPATRVATHRAAVEARGETFYPGPSRNGLASFPPKERWDDWVDLDPKAWPQRVERHSMLVPTTCFNCESACGLLAYVDPETLEVRKFEGNPEHPGSRGRNCAKGPATLNQIQDPERILYPLERVGPRGSGQWRRVSWEKVLTDLSARIRGAIVDGRPNEVMYHVGRPGEDGFAERILAAWGVDGHNSHTNICSSSARAGYQLWCGMDRPSPDHANAKLILLISSHLETGHYFNPHAQRVMEGKANGAKLVVFDTRLSNTATHADLWLAPVPGSEAAILLAIARHLIATGRYDREFVRRWWNWQHYLAAEHPERPATFASFEAVLGELYASYTFAFAAAESGVAEESIAALAALVADAGQRLSTHTWRSATAGNEGGWQVARCLFLLNALTGAIAVPGGTYPNAWTKFVPRPMYVPPHPPGWNELTWPEEYPFAMYELSFLLPHLMQEQRGKLAVYFTRVYNPVWTNPDGFSWIEMLRDEAKIGLHVALTPTWNETAYFADYVLPVGHGSERHDLHSYETQDGQWVGFRQPVRRTARERLGNPVGDTREANPGEVWEENELWLDLTWRIDPDGSLGIRQYAESKAKPGTKLSIDEYYGWIFDHSVPGLPERARAEGLTPLQFMRRYGAFEIARTIGPLHESEVAASELVDVTEDAWGRVHTAAPRPVPINIVPTAAPEGDGPGRRPAGVRIDGKLLRGFPTPSGKLEFWSPTLASWGWRDAAIPTYLASHVHPERLAPDQKVLISTFRLPVHIHTRSANAKWLDEIAHSNPVWIHPDDARDQGLATGDLVRVETEIGHFVVRAWVTEGIRPGVVACSHHMGRWRLAGSAGFGQPGSGQAGRGRQGTGQPGSGQPGSSAGPAPAGDAAAQSVGQRQMMATVSLVDHGSGRFTLRREAGVTPYASSDPDTQRIWWTDAGVHQNLTFPVHPDPLSGMHCWHQAVRVRRAEPGDHYGDIHVDTGRSHQVYREWLARTRPASAHSPDGTRRPYWLMRPLKPAKDRYRLPK